VNVIDDPAGCGAGRSAARDVRVSGLAEGVDDDVADGEVCDVPPIGNSMMPLDWLFSYVSAVVVAFRTQTEI
jgi:hypothetical protein